MARHILRRYGEGLRSSGARRWLVAYLLATVILLAYYLHTFTPVFRS